MSKNIVVFSDGTGQEGGTDHNTNVYKTFNLILDRSANQVSFYDKGLGTGFRKISGNIFGRGFSKNVRECYEFIFEHYQHGDKIFLFGFSRGAATVRSLSGFIHMFGILPRSRGKLISKAWKIYKISNTAKRKKKAKTFVEENHTMWAHVDCLCVWDTVAALGVPKKGLDHLLNFIAPHGFHDFKLSRSVLNAYQALAIDDVRKTFHPILFHPDSKPEGEMKQVWFMGMHTDVGGGYTEKGLSDIVLEWMVGSALKHGLLIYPNPAFTGRCSPEENGHMHDARDKAWKKLVFRDKQREWPEDYGKPVVHESVTLRTASAVNIADGGYAPWIMSHTPGTEPWTHLDDWEVDPAYTHARESLDALKGWVK